jgi:hypothetical protein
MLNQFIYQPNQCSHAITGISLLITKIQRSNIMKKIICGLVLIMSLFFVVPNSFAFPCSQCQADYNACSAEVFRCIELYGWDPGGVVYCGLLAYGCEMAKAECLDYCE